MRVWHNSPTKGGSYQGTAFFIESRYLLTAKHVIEDFDVKNIRLQSDTGAWIEGGLRRIREAHPHPSHDVALLCLDKPVDDATTIPLSQRDLSFLSPGERITLAGFTSGDRGLEVPELQVSAYDGDYNLEVTHAAIGKGMSGGPVLRNGKLVGLTRAKDDSHTFVIPLDAFWDFIAPIAIQNMAHMLLQPVLVTEMAELRQILLDVHIPHNDSLEYFRKTVPDSRPPDCEETDLFRSCIAFLAQKEHAPPEKAPLLEYLEYCEPKIKKQISKDFLERLAAWKGKVADRLEIDMQAVRSRVQKSMQYATAGQVGVLLKIEPKHLVSDERFTMMAWAYRDGDFSPQEIPEQDNYVAGFTRAELERHLPTIITRSLRRLGGEAQNAMVEVIAPFILYDWNINRLLIPAGPLSQPLGKLYSLVLRSWDRIYHDSYDSIRHQWSSRWLTCPARLLANHIYPILEVKAGDQTFYDELTENIYVLLDLFPIPRISAVDHYREIIGVALAAGLPFAFWPLQPCAEDFLQQISNELSKCDFADWPSKLKKWRASTDSIWHDVQMLWDNPENLPPDTGYSLVMYD